MHLVHTKKYMEKILAYKKQIDQKLEDLKIAGIVLAASFIFMVVLTLLFDAILGDEFTFFRWLILFVKEIIITLVVVVQIYVIYTHTIRKPLVEKPVNFILCGVAIFLACVLRQMMYAIIYEWITEVNWFQRAFEAFFPFKWVFDGFESLEYLNEWYIEAFGFFPTMMYNIYVNFSNISIFVYLIGTVVCIVFGLKPDLLDGLLNKKQTQQPMYGDVQADYTAAQETYTQAPFATAQTPVYETRTEAAYTEPVQTQTAYTASQETVHSSTSSSGNNNMKNMYLMTNAKYLPAEKMAYVREKIESLSDDKFAMVSAVSFKDPTVMLLISLFLGGYGVDRFMLGDTGMGVLKLLTGGGCGVLAIIDWFSITKKTKEYNFTQLMTIL